MITPGMSVDEQLLAQLADAERANQHSGSCQVCVALDKMSDRAAEAVTQALSGTIGMRSLARILTKSGYQVGARAVYFHRSGHTVHKD